MSLYFLCPCYLLCTLGFLIAASHEAKLLTVLTTVIPPVNVHTYPISDVAFTDDSRYVVGYICDLGGQKVSKIVKNVTEALNKLFKDEFGTSYQVSTHLSKRPDVPVTLGELATSSTLRTQQAGTMKFFRNSVSGQAEMLVLEQDGSANAVVLNTWAEDGSVRTETLTRVPRSLMATKPTLAATSRIPTGNVIRLIWNSQAAVRYSFNPLDAGSVPPPLLLERRKEKIVTLHTTAEAIEPGDRPGLPFRVTQQQQLCSSQKRIGGADEAEGLNISAAHSAARLSKRQRN